MSQYCNCCKQRAYWSGRPQGKILPKYEYAYALNRVKEIIARAHAKNAAVLVDGAQAAPHIEIDVQALDCDFYTFSSHKMYGPMGIGAVYGKREILETMPPYQGGGDMIASVTFEETKYNSVPHKFEAGTPNVARANGLGICSPDQSRSCQYLEKPMPIG